MSNFFVTGVSADTDRSLDASNLCVILNEPVILFDPEKKSNKSFGGRLMQPIRFLDKTWDVLNLGWWILFNNRHDLLKQLKKEFEDHKPKRVFCHSLGTILILMAEVDLSGCEVYFFGSPLWMPFFWQFHTLRKFKIRAKTFANYYSTGDFIGYKPIDKKMIRASKVDQIKLSCDHEFSSYIINFKK